MKQILLITDGCSNVGISPVIAAAHALEDGVIVNVVGIGDHGRMDPAAEAEIEDTARAGGGQSRIVEPARLSQTVQMMTRKTVAMTIQQAVHNELQHIPGIGSIEGLPPTTRAKVVQVIEDLGEEASLEVVLLIDTSASMKPKLKAVEEAIIDLQLSLQARKGRSRLAVFHFPGKHADSPAELDVDWTGDIANLKRILYKLNMKGTTPSGPALLQALSHFHMANAAPLPIPAAAPEPGLIAGGPQLSSTRSLQRPSGDSGQGVLDDYVV